MDRNKIAVTKYIFYKQDYFTTIAKLIYGKDFDFKIAMLLLTIKKTVKSCTGSAV